MDLYILLGVEREASETDIKRAYRRLARRFHPDINPGDGDSAERFRQILEAYETLIDPERRRRYDSGGSGEAEDDSAFGFAGFDFSRPPDPGRATTFGDLFEDVFARRTARDRTGGAERGADIHINVSQSFDDVWHGVEWPATITRQEACRACGGAGYRRSLEARCVACEGSGAIRSVRGHMVFSKNCPHCGGSGRLGQQTCEACRGQGVETRTESISVRIPPGVTDGARIRVPGKGHAGVRGGPPGDVYLEITVRPHPLFRRVGDDLHMTVPIAVHEAALGARVEIPTPDGERRMRVPPGTQSGQRFRLRERGMPSSRRSVRGDLVVEVQLVLPALLDERSKELLREFGRINGGSVRESLFRE